MMLGTEPIYAVPVSYTPSILYFTSDVIMREKGQAGASFISHEQKWSMGREISVSAMETAYLVHSVTLTWEYRVIIAKKWEKPK